MHKLKFLILIIFLSFLNINLKADLCIDKFISLPYKAISGNVLLSKRIYRIAIEDYEGRVLLIVFNDQSDNVEKPKLKIISCDNFTRNSTGSVVDKRILFESEYHFNSKETAEIADFLTDILIKICCKDIDLNLKLEDIVYFAEAVKKIRSYEKFKYINKGT